MLQTTMSIAQDMRAFVLQSKTEGKPGQVYYPAGVQKIDTPQPNDGEVVRRSYAISRICAKVLQLVGQDICCGFEP